MTVLSLSKVQCRVEENGRILVYDDFEDYKGQNNKTYRPFEEIRCRKAYEENCKRIRAHNSLYQSGKVAFQLRANCFADLNSQNYLKSHVRLVPSPRIPLIDAPAQIVGASIHRSRDKNQIPDSFDWRDQGFKTPPRNQLSCGSCYAFSIAESIEAQVYKRTGKILDLSEQQIVDCSTRTGNKGCAGGSLRNTLKYLEQYGGLMRDRDYPYRAKEKHCRFAKELAVVQISSWAILPKHDEEAIKVAVATIGPVAVSINASPQTFQLYSNGIYDDPDCSADMVNHAMLVVGYTPEYWIMKNWWGDNWGDGGYMKIRRNRNLCGLANYAAYAIV
ncbi:unnamed protein product [Hermetia illucens]|uniref:cathepsin L n=2 Tax=Hermetia illucens TaxID=343691 RepID=A0A7R8V8E7_HERIL|nr:unnamed protein product [Hermetia illucens]